ncbi:MAG: septum formation initiator family protein [Caldilineaceae bacterium]
MSSSRDPDDRGVRGMLERRRPLLAILIVLCLVFVASYTTRLGTLRRLQVEQAKLEERLEAAEIQARVLDDEQERKTSDAYVEQVAVEELGMTRDGDTVVTLLNAPEAGDGVAAGDTAPAVTEPEVAAGAATTPAAPPVWRQWVELFTVQGD